MEKFRLSDSEEPPQPTRKRKPPALVPSKTKKSSFSPWWDHRKNQIAQWMTFGDTSKQHSTLSWIGTASTTPSNPQIDITSQYQDVKKEVKHSAKLSKCELQPDELLRSIKIRIKPTEEQKRIFHKIFGVNRFVYNKAIEFVKAGNKPSFTKLKGLILNKERNPEADQYPWLFTDDVARDAKDMAVNELCAAIASTKESLKSKKAKVQFDMKKRTRKDLTQRFQIPNNGGRPGVTWAPTGFKFWPRKNVGTVKPSSTRELEKIKKLCGEKGCMKTVTIKYEHPGRWYAIFPYVKGRSQVEPRIPVVALDPGIRTFQAGYDSSGKFIDYGTGDIDKIFIWGKKMDKLQSKIDLHKKKHYENKQERVQYKNERHRWRKQLFLMRHKVQNWMRDVHWKMARDLTSKYDHILISRFKVSDLVKRLSRKINSENVRKLLSWSHFLFRQRLKHKAEELKSKIHEVSEHYSSKTCGSCGKVHWKLGSRKTFQCPFCPFTLDRDWNGARNIFLMNIEKSVGLVSERQTNPSSEGGSCNPETISL